MSELSKRQRALIRELSSGDGIYYVTQERAMAPGISGKWPLIIQHPATKNGRLIQRRWKKVKP
jgi:hypothetical protein